MKDRMWDSIPPRGKTRYYSSYEAIPHGASFTFALKRLDAEDVELRELLLGVLIQVMSYCDDEDMDFYELAEEASQNYPGTEILFDEDEDDNKET